MLHCWANPDGTQRIEDTGPLTKKRMDTVDNEFLAAAVTPTSGPRQKAASFTIDQVLHKLTEGTKSS